MELHATRMIRKMRGGAQAHLVECSNGYFYVVKFQNNPQHLRILVNEWLGSSLLTYLKISTPEIVIVNITAEFLARYPDVHIQLHSGHMAIKPGRHFGSKYATSLSETSIYDFVPDVLLEKVVNSNEFLGALVFDKWIGNVDARQAIFRRPPLNTSSTSSEKKLRAFSVNMIDQGYAFGGPLWKFSDSPLHGLYSRPSVYRNVRSLDDFQPWLDQVVQFPEMELNSARARIPAEWILGDEAALDLLLKRLIKRCKRVQELVEDSIQAPGSPFPAWKQHFDIAQSTSV
jgi:hypothetical protein